MHPILSFTATLGILGVAFSIIHIAGFVFELPDLLVLLLFAIPLTIYIAYCTHDTRARMQRAALRLYAGFASVVLASAAIVYFIG